MLQTKSKVIDGSEVKVVEFAGQRNFDVLIDMAQLVGPALGAAGSSKQGDSLLDQDINIGAVVSALLKQMDKDRVRGLVGRMLASTYVDDKPLNDQFDEFFAGPKLLRRLPGVLRFVIEVNFGDFSQLGASITSLTGDAVPSDSSSPESSANA